jgi:hypothetical protein
MSFKSVGRLEIIYPIIWCFAGEIRDFWAGIMILYGVLS